MGGNIIADIASSGGGREVLDISQQDNQQLQFLEVNRNDKSYSRYQMYRKLMHFEGNIFNTNSRLVCHKRNSLAAEVG